MGRTIFGNSDVEKWHAVVARSTFASQNVHTIYSRSTFGNSDVEKWHAAVARSTFSSQHVENMRGSGHFGSSDVEKSHGAVARSTCMHKASAFRSNFGVSDVEKVSDR